MSDDAKAVFNRYAEELWNKRNEAAIDELMLLISSADLAAGLISWASKGINNFLLRCLLLSRIAGAQLNKC